MSGDFAKKGLSTSVIVGTLLVPITALAAVWLTAPGGVSGASAESAPDAVTATSTASQPASPSSIDVSDLLLTACGPEGMELVAFEESGTITEVQQAALDALRDVCGQQGIPLSPPTEAEPGTSTIAVPATPETSVSASTDTTLDDDDHEVEYDDDDYEVEYEDEYDDDDYEVEYEVEYEHDDDEDDD